MTSLPKKPLKKMTISYWKKRADKVFSEYIRRRDKGVCFTCPFRGEWKRLQCGHFVPRQSNATRYEEKNNNSQCFACNMFYGGRPDTYAVNLEIKYGAGIVKKLHELGKTSKQFSIPELQEIIKVYSEKIQNLENETRTN